MARVFNFGMSSRKKDVSLLKMKLKNPYTRKLEVPTMFILTWAFSDIRDIFDGKSIIIFVRLKQKNGRKQI